tara:strand:+ start:2101 stop:3000 length:900 start_codon:yes stop_codon:yes gene_type:complete
MTAIINIVVVLDPTVIRDPVLDRAIMLAKTTQANIRVLVNCHSILGGKSYFVGESPTSIATTQSVLQEQILSSITEEFAANGVSVSFDLIESKYVVESILEFVTEVNADLVLKSTHSHSDLRKSIFTNTDWQLIRQCPSPLWFSKTGRWFPQGKIVAAVDPMHSHAEHVQFESTLIDYAEYVGLIAKQAVCVFHAYYVGAESRYSKVTTFAGNGGLQTQHNQAIYRLLAAHNVNPENVQIVAGDVSEKLLSYLHSIRSNLLVIGALSRSRLERAILGSTAEKVLDETPCDVLVVGHGAT